MSLHTVVSMVKVQFGIKADSICVILVPLLAALYQLYSLSVNATGDITVSAPGNIQNRMQTGQTQEHRAALPCKLSHGLPLKRA